MRWVLKIIANKIYLVISVVMLAGFFFYNFVLQPRIEVTPIEIDLGVCSTGDILRRPIKISNVGNRHLNILKISTSCNCTTMESVPSVLRRGGSVEVEVGIRAGSIEKNLFETVLIESNDKENGIVSVNLHAVVKKLIKAVPDKVDFGVQLFNKLPIRDQVITLTSDDKDWLTKCEIVGEGAISIVEIKKSRIDQSVKVKYNFNSGGFLGYLGGAISVRKIGGPGSMLTVPVSAQIVSTSPSVDRTYVCLRKNHELHDSQIITLIGTDKFDYVADNDMLDSSCKFVNVEKIADNRFKVSLNEESVVTNSILMLEFESPSKKFPAIRLPVIVVDK